MLIVSGVVELIIIFFIGFLLGVMLSYNLFSVELEKQLLKYNHDRVIAELMRRSEEYE